MFKQGAREGATLGFWPNGALNIIKNYRYGYEENTRYTYNRMEALIQKANYVYVVISGNGTEYYPNGKTKTTFHFKMDSVLSD